MIDTDCIVGIASGTPDGGVSVLRLSGAKCAQVAEALLDGTPRARHAGVNKIKASDGSVLDEALVLWMPGPKSFTGENVLELHIHAGTENVRQVLEACLRAGARMAHPGEFSRRAFANGKMSLEQAEALPGLLGAESARDLERARRLLRGELGERVDEIAREIFMLRVEIEAHLDFPEDLDNAEAMRWSERLAFQKDKLVSWSRSHQAQGERSCRFRVVIAGPPNAGKSSLFNALLDRRRSIVSEEAGTTRDFVEASLRWEVGVFDLVDTAGLRSDAGVLEAEGILLGKAEIGSADLVLWVCGEDLLEPSHLLASDVLEAVELLRVRSKSDLLSEVEGWLPVSVLGGHEQGLEQLKEEIAIRLRDWGRVEGEEWIGLDRHARCVDQASGELGMAIEKLSGSDVLLEIVAFHLASCVEALGQIRGRDSMHPVGEEVLNTIFSSFCIGK